MLSNAGDPDFRPAQVTIDEFSAMMAETREESSDTPVRFNESTKGHAEDRTAPSNFEHRNIRNCGSSFYAYLNNFIPNLRNAARDGHAGYNQCTEAEVVMKTKFPNELLSFMTSKLLARFWNVM